MVKYLGKDVTVRIAASTAAVATAVAVSNIQSIEFNANQNIQTAAKGIGQGRATEVYEGLQEFTGNVALWYDAAAIEGGSILDGFVQATTALGSSSLTKRFVEVRHSTAGTYRLKNVLGSWRASTPSTDGFVSQTYDFLFEDLEKI